MLNLCDLVPDLRKLAIEAGQATLPFFRNADTSVQQKDDGSPVTLADKASEDIIVAGLARLTPDIPVIAEELAEDGHAPDVRGKALFWLVDPLDGTKEFIKGSKDFTVNIGLIADGVPVLGAVYLPATGDFYYGGRGIGAFLNGNPISIREYSADEGLMIVASKHHVNNVKMNEYLQGHKVKDHVTRGSSLKFCLVAEGKADIYPRFVPTYEWDTAAAHAILLEVGGDIIDYQTGKRLAYGKFTDKYLNGSLVTGSDSVLKLFNLH